MPQDLVSAISLYRDDKEIPPRTVTRSIDDDVLSLDHVVQTCNACPSQWEARTEYNDRPVYIRYRNGWLSVELGPPGGTDWSAVDGEEWFCSKIGDKHDGFITFEEVCRIARLSECPPF